MSNTTASIAFIVPMVADRPVAAGTCAELRRTVANSSRTPCHRLLRLACAALASCALAACGVSHHETTSAAAPAAPRPKALTPRRSKAVSPPGAFASVAISVPSGERDPPFDQPRSLRLPAGWRVAVWARVVGARLEAWTPEGPTARQLTREGDDHRVDRSARRHGPGRRTIASNLTNPQGLAFDRVGGHEVLYVAESDELDRYLWTSGRLGSPHRARRAISRTRSPPRATSIGSRTSSSVATTRSTSTSAAPRTPARPARGTAHPGPR